MTNHIVRDPTLWDLTVLSLAWLAGILFTLKTVVVFVYYVVGRRGNK